MSSSNTSTYSTLSNNCVSVSENARRTERMCSFASLHSANAPKTHFTWRNVHIYRRLKQAIMMYKIVNNLVDIPADQYLTTAEASTRGHQQRYLVPFCSVNAYKGSFFPTAICLWNTLPASTISSPSIDNFKILVSAGIPRP